ncbi:MAG: 2-oxoacid:acceptor oxidoreductase family protein [Candidatus Latescibacteria bacterium]|nr:2-oxoacid:acceptor oxidoreductase family protein [Candidatus Latescibacterota bacterium]
MRKEIRLAGTGGQGLILAGVILAEAAGVYEGKKVIQTQSYGPEARGGASKTDVIISDQEILYPKARNVDILVCLSQKSCDSYLHDLVEDGVAIYDNFYVKNCASNHCFGLPLSVKTRGKFNREIFMNIVLLGALSEITKITQLDSLKKAIQSHVPAATLENNLQALDLGVEVVKSTH